MKHLAAATLSLTFLFALPSSTQLTASAPSNTGSRRIQNIAPEEMWKRVTQCVLPTYPGLAFGAHIEGTVDIGLGISPEGGVANYRVLAGQPLLAPSAVDAIRQWKFRPNVVQGEVTWSRVRALVRFNADGTTAVDLSSAILADDFGNPGIPAAGTSGTQASTAEVVRRPASAPECTSEQPWTGVQAKEIEASRSSPGLYENNYFGLTFRFPSEWQVANRDKLDSINASMRMAAQSQLPALPANVHSAALPSYLLFFARTDGLRIDAAGPSVEIWAEKWPFIGADQYFVNVNFLRDKTADGTRGPIGMEINGTKYFRADRWRKVDGRGVYHVRIVTYARDLILRIDVVADSAATAEQLVKSLEGITITPSQTPTRVPTTD